MDSENRSGYPCRCSDNELELVEDLVLGCPWRGENEGENGSCNGSGNNNCRMPSFGNNVALAIVYSPDHAFDGMYEPEEGLIEGTMFMALNKPFMGRSIKGGKR